MSKPPGETEIPATLYTVRWFDRIDIEERTRFATSREHAEEIARELDTDPMRMIDIEILEKQNPLAR